MSADKVVSVEETDHQQYGEFFQNPENANKRSRFFVVTNQIMVCLSAIIASVCFGITTSFTATLLPQIRDFVDTKTGSWLASTIVFAMVIGVGACSTTMRLFGRKQSQIFSNVPWLVGWPYLSVARTTNTLFFGSFLVGFSAGFSSTCTTVYTTEVAEPALRSLVATFVSIAVAVGIFVGHTLGVLLPWRSALFYTVLIPLASFSLAFLSPESPTWLIINRHYTKAEEIFYRLRGRSKNAVQEFEAVLKGAENKKDDDDDVAFYKLICTRSFLKPFFILSFTFIVQQGSGLNMVAFYAIDILKRMSNSVDSSMSTLLIDTIRVFSTVLSAVFIKTMKRRTLFFLSAAGTFFSLLAMYFTVTYGLSDKVLVASVSSYVWFVYLGIIPVPWLLCGELYPSETRDLGSGATTIYAFFAIFLVVKTGPVIMNEVAVQYIFIIFASIVLTGSILLFFILPETKNVTLQEVENRLRGRLFQFRR